MVKWLSNWWKEFTKSPEIKYLEKATDHYDLELRMKKLNYQGYFKNQRGNKLTTMTIKAYYCSFCEAVSNFFTGMMHGIIKMGESAGRARAARELTRMGMHKEAKALMTGKDIN